MHAPERGPGYRILVYDAVTMSWWCIDAAQSDVSVPPISTNTSALPVCVLPVCVLLVCM